MNTHQLHQIANQILDELITAFDKHQRQSMVECIRQSLEKFIDRFLPGLNLNPSPLGIPDDLSPFAELIAYAGHEIRELLEYLNIRLEEGHWSMCRMGESHGGRIVINRSLRGRMQFQVIAHELAHELMHANQPHHRTHTGSSHCHHEALCEGDAEAVSYIVSRAFGMHNAEWSVEYLVAAGSTISQLIDRREEICKTAAYILSTMARRRSELLTQPFGRVMFAATGIDYQRFVLNA